MTIPLGVAIYFILWWLAFFMLLPLGAQSLHEAGEAGVPGIEPGAPRSHQLGRKALWAAGLAAVLWVVVYVAIANDVFRMYGGR